MDNAPKKTVSILNRLTAHLQWRRFWTAIGQDFALALVALLSWCYATETMVCTRWEPFLKRTPIFGGGDTLIERVRTLQYRVVETAGAAHEIAIGPFLYGVLVAACILFGVQLLGWALSWVEERNALRRFLKPIDDIALAAERIAAHSFNPDKIQYFEQAIERINAPGTRVDVGDEDLAGLEAAVNNMLKRLQESSRQQMRFVDDASHELRTPIAVIQGYSSMLDRWGKDDPKVLAESIAAIRTESEHMKTLVEQLLFLARGDMGRTQLTLSPLPLATLMSELFEESRMIDPAHEYRLTLSASPAADADTAMLKQAMRILIDNAAKYTEAGGEIQLRLRQSETEALLDAQDSGIGIARADAAHVFERFYRSDAARRQSGSGLGLSIAQWIVEAHGGHIEVKSFEGVGTRMTICLPLSRKPSAPGQS